MSSVRRPGSGGGDVARRQKLERRTPRLGHKAMKAPAYRRERCQRPHSARVALRDGRCLDRHRAGTWPETAGQGDAGSAPIASKAGSLTRALRGRTRSQHSRRCPRPACASRDLPAPAGTGGRWSRWSGRGRSRCEPQERKKVLAGIRRFATATWAARTDPACLPRPRWGLSPPEARPPAETRETSTVTTVGPHLVARGPGDEKGCNDLRGHAH